LFPAVRRRGHSVAPTAFQRHSFLAFLSQFGSDCTKVTLNWKVKQIRYLATKIGSGVTPRGGAQVYQDSGIPLLRSQNVHFDGLRLDDVAFISNEINNEMSNSKVQPNDVLLNITGASIGRCTYVSAMLTEANVNQHVCIIRTDQSELFAPYLASYLSSNHIQTFIDVSQEGAAREGLPQKEIKTIPVAYPPVDEQKQIVKFINEKTAEINTAIERTQREIELIEEYRTTLIAHAVTGKIDVRTHLENARKNVNI
jgi:type I restriction enzyme, S subunit